MSDIDLKNLDLKIQKNRELERAKIDKKSKFNRLREMKRNTSVRDLSTTAGAFTLRTHRRGQNSKKIFFIFLGFGLETEFGSKTERELIGRTSRSRTGSQYADDMFINS